MGRATQLNRGGVRVKRKRRKRTQRDLESETWRLENEEKKSFETKMEKRRKWTYRKTEAGESKER